MNGGVPKSSGNDIKVSSLLEEVVGLETASHSLLRRLPRYLHYLKSRLDSGDTLVSAAKMSETLGIHHTQIRRDITITGVQGSPKVGFDVNTVISAIEEYLNWKDTKHAFLVGTGNLGKALLSYNGFLKSGIKIVAAFDSDARKTNKEIAGVSVFDMSKFVSLSERTKVAIGIITTPAEVAQQVAELMVQSGIVAIWNFTTTALQLEPEVIVESTNLDTNLAVLSRRLHEK